MTSVGDLPADVPRIQIGLRRVLEPGACRKQQVIMLVNIVEAAAVETGLVYSINLVSGLMIYLATKGQLVGDLFLQ